MASAASKVNDQQTKVNGEEIKVNGDEMEVNDEETEVNDIHGSTRSKMEKLMKRLRTEKVNLRVHNILIKGNTKTKDSVIEAELEPLKSATTVQEMHVAAQQVQLAIQRLNVFDSVKIVLDSGPIELPGTANVVVKVVEAKKVWFADLGMFAKPEARWSMQGSLNLRNLFGYGDIWDGSLAYGLNQASEISTGVSLPRFRRLTTPVTARVSLLLQDWLRFSSYKERALGLSLGFFAWNSLVRYFGMM